MPKSERGCAGRKLIRAPYKRGGFSGLRGHESSRSPRGSSAVHAFASRSSSRYLGVPNQELCDVD